MISKNNIHPTAIISETAILGENNYIGPYCLIGPNVIIGSNNHFEAYVSIGTPAEHRDFFRAEPGKVNIGSNNIVREYVTINGGTLNSTIIGDNIILLRGSHVGHDSKIESNVTISCNVLIGGHCIICKGANLGLAAAIHQYRVVGAYSMTGMHSSVTKNVPPFIIGFGSPCYPQRINRIGLTRGGVSEKDLHLFEIWFQKSNGIFDQLPKIDHNFNEYLLQFAKYKEDLYQIISNKN